LITGGGSYSVDEWLKNRMGSAADIVDRQSTDGRTERTVEETVTDD